MATRKTKTSAKRKPAKTKSAPVPGGQNVLVEFDEGIAWVTLNRPEKRNAMSPALNDEMVKVVDALETDDRCGVVVLTGAGSAFSAGMDLKEYFRETDGESDITIFRTRRAGEEWQWRKLKEFLKPTIAMVNGWCFGGAFTPMAACDLAIAADDAVFGLSEINWGIIPAGNVTKAVAEMMGYRDALYYVMTGETFTGKEAAAMGMVNESVPSKRLRKRTRELAKILLGKNPTVLRTAKIAFKRVREMDWDVSADYLQAKASQAWHMAQNRDREEAMASFLDKKEFRPGLETFKRRK
jgi:trans-feruloyl-CoA hydratase/vanillin synthase